MTKISPLCTSSCWCSDSSSRSMRELMSRCRRMDLTASVARTEVSADCSKKRRTIGRSRVLAELRRGRIATSASLFPTVSNANKTAREGEAHQQVAR